MVKDVYLFVVVDEVYLGLMRHQTPRPARPHHRNRLTPRLGRPCFVNGFRVRMSSLSGAQSVRYLLVYRLCVNVFVAGLPMLGAEVHSFRHNLRWCSRVVLRVFDAMHSSVVVDVRGRGSRVPTLQPIVLHPVRSQYLIVQGR